MPGPDLSSSLSTTTSQQIAEDLEEANFYVKQGRLTATLTDYGPTIDASFYEKVE